MKKRGCCNEYIICNSPFSTKRFLGLFLNALQGERIEEWNREFPFYEGIT